MIYIIKKYVTAMDVRHGGDGAPCSAGCEKATHGGYNDWFLLSVHELDLMYQTLHAKGIGGFVSGCCWSSSQSSESHAWVRNFNGNGQAEYGTDFGFRVRATRAF